MRLRVLASSILLSLSASAAEAPPPSMDQKTPAARIPHPQEPVPEKPAEQPGINPGKKGATNAGWLFPLEPHQGFDTLRVTMSPRFAKDIDHNFIYWAYDSTFIDLSTWYVGLQPEGELGRTALFSVFGQGTQPENANCKSGADGGAGTHCHIHYEWQLEHEYEFQVTLKEVQGDRAIWEGSVLDLSSNQRTLIGDISVPASRGYIRAAANTFTEYFHRSTKCPDQPRSEVLFFRPVGYRAGKEYFGKLHSMNANSSCNPRFFSDGSDFVYIDIGN